MWWLFEYFKQLTCGFAFGLGFGLASGITSKVIKSNEISIQEVKIPKGHTLYSWNSNELEFLMKKK